jgi:hypothetical protein
MMVASVTNSKAEIRGRMSSNKTRDEEDKDDEDEDA